MRAPRALSATALAALLAACGGGGPAASGAPASTPPAVIVVPGSTSQQASQDPCVVDPASCATPPASPATGVLLIHGSFTGHFSDPLATADQTVEVDITWNAGPDDVHDRDAFVFTSGSYTFSESIGGVCGGSRTEAGPLQLQGNQSMASADPQARDSARILMIDRRMTEFLLEFSAFSNFGVPNADAEGCADLSRSGVGSCRLKFPQVAADRLAPDATCDSQSGSTWTGHLTQ